MISFLFSALEFVKQRLYGDPEWRYSIFFLLVLHSQHMNSLEDLAFHCREFSPIFSFSQNFPTVILTPDIVYRMTFDLA